MPFPCPRCNRKKERESCLQPISPNAGSTPSNRAEQPMTSVTPKSRVSASGSCLRAASATSSTARSTVIGSGTPSAMPKTLPMECARTQVRALLASRRYGGEPATDTSEPIAFEMVAEEVFRRYQRHWKPGTRKVESGAGAPALGSGGTTPFVGDAVAPKGIPSLSFRSSVRLPWPRFQAPAHQTGRADFPHPAFGRDHVFAHGRSRVFNPRRVRPWSCHSLRFEKRTYLPTLTLCFRQNHRRSRFVACRSIAE